MLPSTPPASHLESEADSAVSDEGKMQVPRPPQHRQAVRKPAKQNGAIDLASDGEGSRAAPTSTRKVLACVCRCPHRLRVLTSSV